MGGTDSFLAGKRWPHRFSVDSRKLNAIIVKRSYPIPHTDKCIDSSGNAAIFSVFGANSRYWQIEPEKLTKTKRFSCAKMAWVDPQQRLSDWETLLGRFNERRTSFGPPSSANQPLPICKTFPSLSIRAPSTWEMSDLCWLFNSTLT